MPDLPSPWTVLDRTAWSRLAGSVPPPHLAPEDLEDLRGLGDHLDLPEVLDVYLPLARLVALHVGASRALRGSTAAFLGEPGVHVPFVVGIAGSVAVGKSTAARVLRALLASSPETAPAQLVTTDGFLMPNAELERRGLLERKGFPESYDQRALLRFLAAVKSGVDAVPAPVYSHLRYDVVPGAATVVRRPEVLIVEGVNVLAPARPRAGGGDATAVSDFFDLSVYVDARTSDVRRWYVRRFLALRSTAFADPDSYFHRYAGLDDDEAVRTAERIWSKVNEVNLTEHILPTRGRADLVLHKGADHAVDGVLLRRV